MKEENNFLKQLTLNTWNYGTRGNYSPNHIPRTVV